AIEPKILLSGNNGFAIRLKVCPLCGKEKVKKEKHHIIPKFLNPFMSITITICKPCHQKLNAMYVKYPSISVNNISNNFKEFRSNYDKLRTDFYNRKLTRSQFGESLWTNIVTFLESIDGRLNELENKK
ncbi:MAG: hypothetical protein AABY22_22445, partial [Nanoarchaeota archaeon]